jgi:4-hydroxy-tetrahydrodipicolinate reductase
MGQRLVALGHADAELEIAAALEYSGCPKLGTDAGVVAGIGEIGVELTSELETPVDAVIDFSVPASAVVMTEMCVSRKLPLVVATTGLTEDQQATLTAAADNIPLVWAPNMSIAVNLTMKLATIAAAALKDNPAGADVEVIERHHRFKEDSPSGTALRFGELIAAEMGQTHHQHGREGLIGQRPHHEIGYHALRVGDNPGEHTIVFGLIGETIELTVRATNRDSYALGALAAARFVAKQDPGHYTMYDVLGL